MLSIVIPVYNGMPFLPEAIRSALNVEVDAMEVLIIDDCSTDDTHSFVCTLDDKRISVHRNPVNLGMAANWNRAISLAKGEFVKLLCADDVLVPESCRSQYLALCDGTNPGVSMVSGRRRVIGPDGRTIKSLHGLGRLHGRVAGVDAIRRTTIRGTNIFGEPSAVMFSRQLALEVGGFSAEWNFFTDLDFFVRLLERGDLIAQPTEAALFRVSNSSNSVSIAGTHWGEARKYFASLRANGLINGSDYTRGICQARLNEIGRRFFYWRALRD